MKILLGIQISPICFFFLVETSCHVKKYMNYMYVLSFVLTGVLAKIYSLQPVFKTNAFSNKGGEHKENINDLL